MMLSGIGSYLLTFGALRRPGRRRSGPRCRWRSRCLLQPAILVAVRRRCCGRAAPSRALRAIAVVFLGTLGAGQVLNLYSQPHDPQMQVNVMAWLTVAWALLLAGAG